MIISTNNKYKIEWGLTKHLTNKEVIFFFQVYLLTDSYIKWEAKEYLNTLNS